MGNFTFDACRADYLLRWENLKLNDSKLSQFEAAATKINNGKAVYQSLEQQTGIPWYFIGMLHLRESDCNFGTHLHNGDSLRARTHNVPAGRPKTGTPPFTFEFSALDALQDYKGVDWATDTVAKIAYNSEKFNGFGYRMHGVPSAYLWAGTNQYVRGKYISDGVWSPTAVDQQLGCMGVLKILLEKYVTAPAPTPIPIPVEQAPTSPLVEVIPSPKATISTPTNAEMNKVSRKHYLNDIMAKVSAVMGFFGLTFKAGDSLNLESTQSTINTIKEIASAIGPNMFIIGIIGLACYFLYQNSMIKEDVVEGRTEPSGGNPLVEDNK